MLSIKNLWPAAVIVTALALLSGGCQVSTRIEKDLDVSPDTARVLRRVDSKLSKADAEVRIRCRTDEWTGANTCRVAIDGSRGTGINAEMIDHPFEGTPMVYRITGGSQAFQGALYEALGAVAPTTVFNAELFEREIELEDKGLKFRCTRTREGAVAHQCWTLIKAELID